MSPSNSKRSRIIALIGAPLIVVGLIVILLQLFGRNDFDLEPTTSLAATDPTAALGAADLSSAPEASESGTEPASDPTPVPVAPEDIVAQVNQRVIPVTLFEVAQSVDQAITSLLAQPPSAAADILEIVVNGELVWQQAEQASYTLGADQIATSLENFLTSQGKSISDLELALAQENLSLAAFQAYYGRLLVINGFSQQQAQNQGITLDQYIAGLQSESQISFGPAAVASSVLTAPEIVAEVEPADQSDESDSADQSDPAAEPRGTQNGQLAPDFELPALNFADGDFLTLGDLAGKPVLLSFWTTWCPYCRAQTPILVTAHERYADQVEFVGINVREAQVPVQNYVNQNLMVYPVLLDESGRVADSYGVSGFPTTYFLNAEGRVVARQIGQLKPEQVDQFMSQLLSSPAP